jgi:hypothetical protein
MVSLAPLSTVTLIDPILNLSVGLWLELFVGASSEMAEGEASVTNSGSLIVGSGLAFLSSLMT